MLTSCTKLLFEKIYFDKCSEMAVLFIVHSETRIKCNLDSTETSLNQDVSAVQRGQSELVQSHRKAGTVHTQVVGEQMGR